MKTPSELKYIFKTLKINIQKKNIFFYEFIKAAVFFSIFCLAEHILNHNKIFGTCK